MKKIFFILLALTACSTAHQARKPASEQWRTLLNTKSELEFKEPIVLNKAGTSVPMNIPTRFATAECHDQKLKFSVNWKPIAGIVPSVAGLVKVSTYSPIGGGPVTKVTFESPRGGQFTLTTEPEGGPLPDPTDMLDCGIFKVRIIRIKHEAPPEKDQGTTIGI